MVSKQLRHANRIERKPNIPESARTSGRDAAADWIEEHAANNWTEWTFSEIADETDYSRQHIANVVENYFQPTDTGPEDSNGTAESVQFDRMPDDSEVPDWVIEKVKNAYRDGMQDGIEIGKNL